MGPTSTPAAGEINTQVGSVDIGEIRGNSLVIIGEIQGNSLAIMGRYRFIVLL